MRMHHWQPHTQGSIYTSSDTGYELVIGAILYYLLCKHPVWNQSRFCGEGYVSKPLTAYTNCYVS